MNDEVERAFTDMFAPNPIPQSVVELFDAAQFFVSRIDQQFRTADLAIIAALGVKMAAPVPVKPKLSETIDMTENEVVETSSFQPAILISDATPGEPQTSPEPRAEPEPTIVPPAGRTGPMDAETANPDFERGMSRKRLNRLSTKELRVHAQEFYGLNTKKTWSKQKIITVIQLGKPIKSGAQAKHPSER